MVYKIKPFAELDLAESMDWYNLQQPGLELTFLDEVEKTIKHISQNPYGYAVRYKRKGIAIRFALVDRFPFVIVFFWDEMLQLIVIEAIWHTSRNPKHWKNRV